MRQQVITGASASGAQLIEGSLRFDKDEEQYLTRTPSGAGSQTLFTWSVWVKRERLGDEGTADVNHNPVFCAGTSSSASTDFRFQNNGSSNADEFWWINWDGGSTYFSLESFPRYRDVAGWYHIVCNYNGTTAYVYINGTLVTSYNTETQNGGTSKINSTSAHSIGCFGQGELGWFGGLMSQFYLVDGLPLGPSYFGYTDPLTNVWRPKKFRAERTTVNDGTVWSNGLTAAGSGGWKGSHGAATGFDESSASVPNLTTWPRSSAPSNNGLITFTPPTPIPYNHSIRAYNKTGSSTMHSATWSLNGGPQTSVNTASTDGWVTIATGSGKLTTLTTTRNGDGEYFATIEIDGVPLLDSRTQNLDYGTNGCYLPMDGSSPIGKDQSGKGNDWTPMNFGSGPLDKATGGLPILNTVGGGNVATAGVRTDTAPGNGPVGVSTGCILAVPFAGIASDRSNQVNSASTNKIITGTGAPTASTTTSNFYSHSYYFDSSSTEYFTITPNTDFGMGVNDFTIEMWVYFNDDNAKVATANQGLFGIGSYLNGMYIRAGESGTGTMYKWFMEGGSSFIVTANDVVQAKQWVHLAFVRQSGTVAIFVNGEQKATGTKTNNFSNNTVYVGRAEHTTGEPLDGYMQDLRVYKGVCKYPPGQSFIPASTNPAIQSASPSGVAQSSQLTEVSSGCVSFKGGDDDYLSLNPGADFAFGTGDFTVELFLYYNGDPAQYDYIIDGRNGSQTTGTWSLSHDYTNSGAGLLMFSTDSSSLLVAGRNPTKNRWTHVAVSRNGSSLKMFYDGEQVASVSDTTNFSTSPSTSYIGTRYSTEHSFDGFMSNLRVVKGTAVYTAEFVPPTKPLTNITNTKLLCCNSTDSATNSTVQPNAISATGTVSGTPFNPFNTTNTLTANTPIGKPSHFATFNRLDTSLGDSQLVNGDLDMLSNGSWNTSHARGTVALTSGKWYWECTALNTVSHAQFGFGTSQANLKESYSGGQSQNWTFYWNNGREVIDPAGSSANYFGTGTMQLYPGDTMSVALDMDNGTWQFFRLGRPGAIKTLEDTDDASTSSITELYPFSGVHSMNLSHNFGQKPFKYPPPEGFEPVCLAGLNAPEVLRPDQYVGVTTYTGNGSTQSLTGLGFQPDLVWIKVRTGAYNHVLYDSVRGPFETLEPSATGAQNDRDPYGVTSFDTDGFSVKGLTNGDYQVNGTPGGTYSGSTGGYVAWCWKAGGKNGTFNIDDKVYANAAAAAMDVGDLTVTGCSVGTQNKFSIVQYTGNGSNDQTVAHGLGVVPSFVIVKDIDNSMDWVVKHHDLTSKDILYLNSTDDEDPGTGSNNGIIDDLSSTTTVNFTNSGSGNMNMTNKSSTSYIMYSWANVPGMQKFGTYTGNQSTDGPFIDLGFRPALLIIKSKSANSTNWRIMDNERRSYNWGPNDSTSEGGPWLKPNDSAVEAAERPVDFLSNGFKIQGAWGGDINYDSGTPTYVYAAWAEAPFNSLYGGQSNAR